MTTLTPDSLAVRLYAALNAAPVERAMEDMNKSYYLRVRFERLEAFVEKLIAECGALPRVRHVKRKTDYEIVGHGEIQTDTPLTDYAAVTIYRDVQTERIWVRPSSEFNDGRFVPLPPPPGEAT